MNDSEHTSRARHICKKELDRRIHRMQSMLNIAEKMLDEGNMLQCAVRLQNAAKEAEFDEMTLNIFDSVSDME